MLVCCLIDEKAPQLNEHVANIRTSVCVSTACPPLAQPFRQDQAEAGNAFDNLHKQHCEGLIIACYACYGMKSKNDVGCWVAASYRGKSL